MTDSLDFYASVPVFRGFAQLMDPALYKPLPDDWTLGLADVVQSTRAIRAQRYKAVNTAGASVIAAVANALGGRAFPFVFGGDGASFAVGPADLPAAQDALSATAAWVRDELDMTLRIAAIPVAALRARGLDLRVARFGPSENVSYAMFSGGGVGWAEAAMKRGEIALEAGPPGARPDLTGLSCRFSPMPASRGVVLSVVIVPTASGDAAAFRAAIEAVAELVERSPGKGNPAPPGGPPLGWPSEGVALEARAGRAAGGSLALRRLAVLARSLFAFCLFRTGISLGRFSPERYLQQLVANSDFRKFDDGLRMVLDCSSALADAIEALLARAAAEGVLRYGLHREGAAMMTCFTPSAVRSDHVHFIDGAGGGYAAAAAALKGG